MSANALPVTRVEWIDRETLRYVRDGERVDVWLDYEPGLLSRGRLLKRDSIKTWIGVDGTTQRELAVHERDLVIAAVLSYCKAQGVSCRVVE